jgi:hypothetical protein
MGYNSGIRKFSVFLAVKGSFYIYGASFDELANLTCIVAESLGNFDQN